MAVPLFANEYLSDINKDFVQTIKLFYILPFNNILLVTQNGDVYGFGSNNYGILGFGHNNEVKQPEILIPLSQKQIIDFRHGCNFCLALTLDGKLYSFGDNNFNQLGYCTYSVSNNKPRFIESLSSEYIVQVSCGKYHTLVLTQNSEVFGWGNNKLGQIGIISINETIDCPKKIIGFNDEKVKSISCGLKHSLALTTKGTVYFWGHTKKENHLEKDEIFLLPRKIKLSEKNIVLSVIKISGGKKISLLLTTNGDIFTIKCNEQNDPQAQLNKNFNPSSSFTFFHLISSLLTIPHFNLIHQYTHHFITEKIIAKPRIEFLDIYCHWSQERSIAQSVTENVYYVSEEYCDDVIIYTFIGTGYNSIDEALYNLANLTVAAINISEKEKFSCYKTFFEQNSIISYGGFGIVSKVKDKHDNNIYAIKRIAFHIDIEKIALRGAFIMKNLKSEFVVNVKCFWVENNYLNYENKENYKEVFIKKNFFHPVHNPKNNLLLHIQMEQCFNTLKEILIQIRYEMNEREYEIKSLLSFYISSELFNEILEGVQFLHSRSYPIIHRDLKPSNILISFGSNGRFVKIGDFGLSKEIESHSQSNTSKVGTQGYIAPEVLRGRNYSTKADVYSLGSFIDQIFNFDINDLRIENIKNVHLRNKYSILVEIQNKMIAHLVKDRTNVTQVLEQKSLWSFNIEMVKVSYTISKFKKKYDTKIEEGFCCYFLQKKLKSLNSNRQIKLSTKIDGASDIVFDGYFNNYEILKSLSIGNFSQEFECINKFTNELSVVKKIEIKKQQIESIIRENEIILNLKNELILQMKMTWIEKNRNEKYFLYMENELRSKTLLELDKQLLKELKCNKLSESLIGFYIISEMMKEVIEGIDYLHKNHIIHGNLNPMNILISDNEFNGKYVKISEFGFSCIFMEKRLNSFKVSNKYLAPELNEPIHRKNIYDYKVDIYSLGVILEEVYSLDKISIGSPIYQNNKALKKLLELKELMLSFNYDMRPNCEMILSKSYEWSLSLEDLIKFSELSVCLREKREIESMDENFVQYFLRKHLLKFCKM